MKYCNQCRHEAPDEDIFCHKCGGRLSQRPQGQTPSGPRPESYVPPKAAAQKPYAAGQPIQPDPNQVRYVQVDTRTGRVTDVAADARRNSRSDALMKGMIIAFAAIAVVIVMAAGAMFISGQTARKWNGNDGYTAYDLFPVSSERQEEVSSVVPTESEDWGDPDSLEEDDSSEPEPVSSVADELKADVLRRKLKGKWTTKLPYKGMSLPVTFTFDDAGGCSCVMKALFITKKFEGHYTVSDGGACTITLEGLEEYMSTGNTLSGNATFVTDQELHFTFGQETLVLNKLE